MTWKYREVEKNYGDPYFHRDLRDLLCQTLMHTDTNVFYVYIPSSRK